MTDLLNLISDLQEKIIMLLPCKFIIMLKLSCKYLNTYITNNDLINERKYLGFPRKSGYHIEHKIP